MCVCDTGENRLAAPRARARHVLMFITSAVPYETGGTGGGAVYALASADAAGINSFRALSLCVCV